MQPVYQGHEFEALKLQFESHAQLLRALTGIDLRIITGFITIQLLLGGWVSANPPAVFWTKLSLFLPDLALAGLAARLLWLQSLRRKEEVSGIQSVCKALGYYTPGIYLPSEELLQRTAPRLWFWWYICGIALSVAGFIVALCAAGPLGRAG